MRTRLISFFTFAALVFISSAHGFMSDEPVDFSKPVLNGLDPVELVQGSETQGQAGFTARHGIYLYQFANAQNRETFLAAPEKYAIQLEGACAYMAHKGAAPTSGRPHRFYVHDQRIYIFGTDNCRETFKTDPKYYLAAIDKKAQ